jgi:hypothetical protein
VPRGPILLRRPSRRFFRRLVFVGALAGTLLVAPGAAGVPGDPTPPVVTPTMVGTLGGGGWYRSTVTVNWAVTDPESIILSTTGCNATTFTTDTTGTQLSCSATSDGGTTTITKTIKVDKTPPTVATVPGRAPNPSGWYTTPLTVSFAGADPTSGIAPGSCTTATYSGPDNAGASASGTCTDVAGNVAGATFPFKYDATAPTLSAVQTKPGNRSVQLTWRASSDTRLMEVLRAPGRNGQGESIIFRGSRTGYRDTRLVAGRKYEYRVRAYDEASNRAEHIIKLVATGALLSPAPGARVSLKSLPELIWTPVKKTSYYNLQLVRGRRVLSAWPVRPGFRLRRTWIYRGQRHRLRPGVYRWYVWPGKGRLSAGRYGRLLGSSTFVVAK